MTPAQASLRAFWDVVDDIGNGDLLLWRRRGLISIAGRGQYSHAAMVGWWGHAPMVLEVREFHGGRAVTLDSQVKRYPGRIDVYRADPYDAYPYNRDAAVGVMRSLCGCHYGYANVLKAALLHLPFVRCFIHPDVDDDAVDTRPPFCSQAISYAMRLGGGCDPVPNLADRLAEPSDLARSPFFKYLCTLVP